MAAARNSFTVFPLGDSAVLAEFGTSLDLEVNARLQRLADAVRARGVPWIVDIVPALGSLALHFDPARMPPELDPVAAAEDLLQDCLRGGLRAPGHRVLMMGFAPGQPYIGGLDAALVVPRRATPRTRVPAGSVAIANAQTAVYPFEISGGWNVIGRTPLRVFDVTRDPAALFTPGMNVRFVAIARAEYERLRAP